MHSKWKGACALAVLAFVTLGAAPASAGTLLVAPNSIWEYTTTNPTADPNWTTSTGGGWSTGQAPFGTSPSSDPGNWDDPNTYWAPHTSLWVRTTFDATGFDLDKITWGLGVDNGFTLFLNGTQVATGYAEGYTYRWEYTGVFSSSLVTPGLNYLAVALADGGGATAFDMQVTGVPEPGSLILLGTGAAALVGRYRRRQRARA